MPARVSAGRRARRAGGGGGMNPQDELRGELVGDELAARRRDRYLVERDRKDKPVLPSPPDADDPAGQCAFLTAVLNLDRAHPITAGEHQGLEGGDGHIQLTRLDAPPLRFEPASRMSNAAK